MRTTITLEDDAFGLAQSYAQARGLTLGQAISELIRRGTSDTSACRGRSHTRQRNPSPRNTS